MLTHDIMKPLESSSRLQQGSSLAACLLLATALVRVLAASGWTAASTPAPVGVAVGDLGIAFLTRFVVPFELVSILLLVTLVGAVVIARKEEREPPDTILASQPALALDLDSVSIGRGQSSEEDDS
jgi:NADH:ubiquinone oxidoreductase subunit 6 (subunit J)